MKDIDEKYWFPARKWGGWGWGVANNWQGALVQLGCPALAAAEISYFRHQTAIALGLFAALTIAFVAIHWVKGEPPSWNW